MWRRKYHADIWGGLLRTLRSVSFNRAERNDPVFTQVLVEEEESSEDEDEIHLELEPLLEDTVESLDVQEEIESDSDESNTAPIIPSVRSAGVDAPYRNLRRRIHNRN
ncbi:unnamed protein product [Mucor circinelloides]